MCILSERLGGYQLNRRDWENGSGYYDPTAYQAMKNIRYLPIVYICSPYSGDVEGNTKAAQAYSKFAVKQGTIPLAPHLIFPQFLDDGDIKERRLAMRMNLILLGRCQELWVFGDVISEGMQEEISRAKHRQMPIRWFSQACQEVKS